MGARSRLRGGSLVALALIVSLGAAAIPATEADAGAAPFPVALSVTGSAAAGVDEVTVVATSVSNATCSLQVLAGRAARSFPGASTGSSGTATWQWPTSGIASDLPWKFTAVCRLGALWTRRWVARELGFPSRSGALLPSASTGASLPGASCDGQGMCFAEDPFPVGQCTWYAAGRRPDLLGIVHGNAGLWLEAAKGRVPEGILPAVGALAVWRPHHGGTGEDGHVAYVAALSEEGPILIDDSNWTPTPSSPGLQVHEHWVSWASPSGYIYGGPAGAGPSPQ
jgi:surface antigen